LLTFLLFWHLSAGWALGKGDGKGRNAMPTLPRHVLVLEPSLSLRRAYSVLESAIKYTFKINNRQRDEWNDEVLGVLFNLITNFKFLFTECRA
jgi:hypothetical protein